MATIPDTEPARITRGDTTEWTVHVDDYSAADGWALSYDLVRPDGGVEVAITATQYLSGPDFLVTIDAAKAAEFTEVGTYLWRAKVTQGADTVTVRRGRLEILDPFTGSSDRRRWLEIMVAALEARATGRATAQDLSKSVEGRSISLMSLSEVLDVRDRLRAELEDAIKAEDMANGHTRSDAVRVNLWG